MRVGEFRAGETIVRSPSPRIPAATVAHGEMTGKQDIENVEAKKRLVLC